LAKMSVNDDRNASVDVMRGIAIILVVLGHATRGAMALPGDSGAALRFLDWFIYCFHMPAFFYLAGYFTGFSLRNRPVADFARSRVGAVLRPYVVWSLIYFVASQVVGRLIVVNQPISVTQLLSIGWAPIHVLWFLYALLMMQIAAMVAGRVPWAALLVAVTLDALAFIFLDSRSLLSQIAIHAPFFFLGMAMIARAAPPLPRLRSTPVTIGACALFVAAAWCVHALDVGAPVSFLMLPLSVAGIAALALLAQRLASTAAVLASLLATLGRASLAIYLLHVLVLALVPRLLRFADADTVPALLILGTLVGTFGSYAIFVLLNKARLARPLGLR
jgi:fucose 4-O-acetylase-like acetyltransferase